MKFKNIIASVLVLSTVICGNVQAKGLNLPVTDAVMSGNSIELSTTTTYVNDIKKNIPWGVSSFKYYKAKNGFKRVTFTITKYAPSDFSQEEIDTMFSTLEGGTGEGGTGWVSLMDSKTGMSLAGNNDKNVTVMHDSVTTVASTSLRTSGGETYYPYQWSTKFTVIYPKKYKNLCLIVGGYNYLNQNSTAKVDKAFLSGKKPFTETNMYGAGEDYYKILNIVKLEAQAKSYVQ